MEPIDWEAVAQGNRVQLFVSLDRMCLLFNAPPSTWRTAWSATLVGWAIGTWARAAEQGGRDDG